MTSGIDSFGQQPDLTLEHLKRLYSARVIDHILNPRNVGQFERADGFGRATRPCGDTIQFCLRVSQRRITDVKFMTDGCGPAVACGSATTELIKGKSVSEAFEITQDDILEGLDGLPESEVHCSLLAANALRHALLDYLSMQREPWKKAYRKIEPFPVSR